MKYDFYSVKRSMNSSKEQVLVHCEKRQEAKGAYCASEQNWWCQNGFFRDMFIYEVV